MLEFTLLNPRVTHSMLGLLPSFWSVDDPHPAREQAHINYAHGGGWTPIHQNKWSLNSDLLLTYKGDPAMRPLAKAQLRNEMIVIYPHAWVAIIQPDWSFEVSRMD